MTDWLIALSPALVAVAIGRWYLNFAFGQQGRK